MLDLTEARLEKHSVSIAGHRTSISLERVFWRHLKCFAERDAVSVASLIRQLDEARAGSLSGAIRAYVVTRLEADHIAITDANAASKSGVSGALDGQI